VGRAWDFKGRHFTAEVILWAVRWYPMFPISYRDLELMLLDRGVEVDPSVGSRPMPRSRRSGSGLIRGCNGSWRVDEQDHRGAKPRIGPMLGFKWSRIAALTISGIELLRRIHKGQFNLGGLRLKDRSTPAVWNALLAA
jgi:transposase-like protein